MNSDHPRTDKSTTELCTGHDTRCFPNHESSSCKEGYTLRLSSKVLLLATACVVAIVALLLARLASYQSPRVSNELVRRLRSFDVQVSMSDIPITYLDQTVLRAKHASVSAVPVTQNPDTTAIILNWSRLENVLLISAVLCGPLLDDTIAEVFVWNNNPNVTLTKEIFRKTGCTAERLRIYNSPSNLLFQARFLACAEARTPYCFTQDDDYLVQSEVIRNLHLYISQYPTAHSWHLLPPHEHLLSYLRTFTTRDGAISTAFAWLGHGTYFHRSSARDFLDLLRALNATDDEMKMADNYFTILANHPKIDEIWFDHGIELGGGQPFTVGSEGDARNDRHIARALEYLSSLVSGLHPASKHPYISGTARAKSPGVVNFAPCRVSSCVVSSNIDLLPATAFVEFQGIDMESVARRKLHTLDVVEVEWYIQHPLSSLVDTHPQSAFRSLGVAKPGDWITLDALGTLEVADGILELCFLTDDDMESMFRHEFSFASSVDGEKWSAVKTLVNCFQTNEMIAKLVECSVEVEKRARYFRVLLSGSNIDRKHWVVYELWLRYKKLGS